LVHPQAWLVIRGIGFVDFETTKGAEAAMRKFDTILDGRPIFVDGSTPRPGW